MRHGFTTGSCAAAAAKAATIMLLSGNTKSNIEIITPAGVSYATDILEITKSDNRVSCAVKKDAGDDPDVTDGIMIVATIEHINEAMYQDAKDYNNDSKPFFEDKILIYGGIGVGKVTKKGLTQEIGEAAINETPRKMIASEIRQVCESYDYDGYLRVTISAENGEEIAKKTFNERLGIVGGISILGTSGIVEPMSQQAIIDTIRVEMKQRRAYGEETLVITPGNYGRDFIGANYDYDLEKAVKISNYVGKSIDIACELGFKKVLLVGHIGKLVKIAGGIMNTHSKEADCRMEIMSAAALLCDGPKELAVKILSCVSTDAAMEVARQYGYDKPMAEVIFEKIVANLNRRAEGKLQIECLLFSNEYGVLGATAGAEEMLKRI